MNVIRFCYNSLNNCRQCSCIICVSSLLAKTQTSPLLHFWKQLMWYSVLQNAVHWRGEERSHLQRSVCFKDGRVKTGISTEIPGWRWTQFLLAMMVCATHRLLRATWTCVVGLDFCFGAATHACQKQLKGKLILLDSWEQAIFLGETWQRKVAQLFTSQPKSGSRDRWMLGYSFLYSTEFLTPDHGMMSFTSTVVFPIDWNLFGNIFTDTSKTHFHGVSKSRQVDSEA